MSSLLLLFGLTTIFFLGSALLFLSPTRFFFRCLLLFFSLALLLLQLLVGWLVSVLLCQQDWSRQ